MAFLPDEFEKSHDYLICVDSDGCAVDTMDIKHKACFGPCMVAEWELEAGEAPVLARWNEINLYSMTRGINRFKGLAMALAEVNEQYTKIEGIEDLQAWVADASELSNPALAEAVSANDAPILKKALRWSQAVNESINRLPWEVKRVFPGVREGFESVRNFADIVIVSSANRDAVEEEWERFGLLPLVDLVMCQDMGSKDYCIAQLKKKGYAADHILMVGDAPGDRAAAQANNVRYYPILVRREKESWEEFPEAAARLREGSYAAYETRKIEEFLENLSNKSM